MKNYKDKYKLISKFAVIIIGAVLCLQTQFIFSKVFYGANSGLAYGLAAAEVISKSAILLFVFHIIITLFNDDN